LLNLGICSMINKPEGERGDLEDLRVDRRVILKWILKKYNGLFWLWIWERGMFLKTQ